MESSSSMIEIKPSLLDEVHYHYRDPENHADEKHTVTTFVTAED